jgi:hypothetical protein
MGCEDLLRVMTEKIYLGISTYHYPPFSVVSQMHDKPIGASDLLIKAFNFLPVYVSNHYLVKGSEKCDTKALNKSMPKSVPE